MKILSSQQPITIAALAFGLLGFVLAAISLVQVQGLSTSVNSATTKFTFDALLDENEPQIDKHIQGQIDAYIQRQRQERVAQKYEAYQNAAEHTRTGNHIYGKEDARFTLVEYSDTECPYCKRYHSSPKAVVDSSNGLVNWQWKHLPLPMHNPVATVQAQAAECVSSIAGNRAFWVWLNQVFDESKGNGQGAGDLALLAQSIGVDVDKFASCVNSGKFRDKVADDIQSAKEIGVNSTPMTFIVDNHTGQSITLRGVTVPEAIASAIKRMKQEADESAQNKNG